MWFAIAEQLPCMSIIYCVCFCPWFGFQFQLRLFQHFVLFWFAISHCHVHDVLLETKEIEINLYESLVLEFEEENGNGRIGAELVCIVWWINDDED